MRALFDDLTVVSGHLLLPEGLENELPAVDRAFAGFRDGGRDARRAAPGPGVSGRGSALLDRVGRFERFVDRVGGRPRHAESEPPAYRAAPSAVAVPPVGADLSGERKRPSGSHRRHLDQDPWPSTLSQQRYLLQAGFVDRLLGRLVRRLRERGLYERSMIVVTADHGVSFTPGGARRFGPARERRRHRGRSPLRQAARTEARAGWTTRPARTIDILPTIARALGVSLSGDIDGRPLQGRRPAREPVTVSSYRGDTVRVPFGAFVRGREAAVRRRINVAAGPNPELVGRRLSGLAVEGSAEFRLDFDSAQIYSRVAPDGGEVRCTSRAGSRVRRATDRPWRSP